MYIHELPLTVSDAVPLVPSMTYCVVPRPGHLAQHGITWKEGHALEMAFFTTKEMMNSLESLLVAYEAAGYIDASSEDADEIALDADGKRKLVRNNWELVTVGWRRLHLVPGTTRWAQTFTPFGTVLTPTETWQCLVYAACALEVAAQRVLNRSIKVIGLNSDAHTSANKFAKKLALEHHTNCFPHIVRGPTDRKQRHLVVGTQGDGPGSKDKFLNEQAVPDVTAIHLCQTTEQVCV